MGRKKLQLDDLLTQILRLTIRHPPSKLTFSLVSRHTGVPRSTLYYYFGNSRKAMMDEAVRFGLKAFFHFSQFETLKRHRDWKSFQRARLQEVVKLVEENPWAPHLYFQYRNNAGEWGDTIREIEESYCQKMARAWQDYHGQALDMRLVRLSSYLKLGFLWGFAFDSEIWLTPQSEKKLEPVFDLFTETITRTLELKI